MLPPVSINLSSKVLMSSKILIELRLLLKPDSQIGISGEFSGSIQTILKLNNSHCFYRW